MIFSLFTKQPILISFITSDAGPRLVQRVWVVDPPDGGRLRRPVVPARRPTVGRRLRAGGSRINNFFYLSFTVREAAHGLFSQHFIFFVTNKWAQ
jgi:hypothetical protein